MNATANPLTPPTPFGNVQSLSSTYPPLSSHTTHTNKRSSLQQVQSSPRPNKRRAADVVVGNQSVSEELGELIAKDCLLLSRVGWQKFVRHRRGRGDFASLDNITSHPARNLLLRMKHEGVPVRFTTPPWSRQRVDEALKRGPHRSCRDYIDFLEEEFIDMIKKGQWTILPASVALELEGLRVSPPGVVPQRDRRPRWICDYTFSGVNPETSNVVPKEAMQFGHALDRILREILLADPRYGPVYQLKIDLSDGFYRGDLAPDDCPKLGVVFPSRSPTDEPMVAIPLVLPMGWCESPPAFSAITETIADVANDRLDDAGYTPSSHKLDDLAAEVVLPTPAPHEKCSNESHSLSVNLPPARDPSLPAVDNPLQYVDVFVDDFCSFAQKPFLRRVRRTLLHAIDDVFRPLDGKDSPLRREPVSLKKLRQGDCTWSTVKLVLGWVIDTVSMTIHLPPHRVERLWEILDSIPKSQKRTSIKKWHKVLGELRSMSIALPGSRNLFGQLQKALSDSNGGRVTLKRGVHQALDDFRWIASDLASRPTRIAELVPLTPVAEGHHDASGKGAGGIWFPGNGLVPRTGIDATKPVVWRLQWPADITADIVSSDNPKGTITNSDLELAGGLLHLDAAAQSFDIRERTVVSKGDNLNTTFWERKGSTTSNSAPAYLLRMFGIHQRYHRYVPRFDYLSGSSNPVADALSRDFHLTLSNVMLNLSHLLPQDVGYQVWTPRPALVSAVISALRRKQSPRESLLVEPTPPSPTGSSGSPSQLNWASTPFSKPSRTKYQSYKSSSSEFVTENLQPKAIQSGLDRLKITYGQLHRRSSPWGPRTLV